VCAVAAAAVVGEVLLWTSNQAYYCRTKDPKYFRRFWLYRELLTPREYLLNRLGLSLVLTSCLAMGIVWLVLW
jgi:hypothetical protein